MTRQFSLSSETEERDLCNALVDGTKIKTPPRHRKHLIMPLLRRLYRSTIHQSFCRSASHLKASSVSKPAMKQSTIC